MSIEEIPITKSQFESFDWREIIRECKDKQCCNYYNLFFKEADKYSAEKETDKKNVCTFLGHLCSMMLKPDSPNEPYEPQLVFYDKRSAIIDDFSEQQLDELTEIVEKVEDPELKARISDILWIKKRDFKFALIAIDSYIEAARNLFNHAIYIHYTDRMERALRLSISLSNHGKLMNVVHDLEKGIDEHEKADLSYFQFTIMKLLFEIPEVDASKYIELSEKLASEAESEKNYPMSRAYWEINAKWNEKVGDENKQSTALENAAETHYKQSTLQSSDLIAAHHLEKTIEAFRKLGGHKERIEQVHKELLKKQSSSISELNQFSHEFDFSDIKESSIKNVKGKSFQDSIFALVLSLSSPPIGKLREQVKENVKKYPLQHIIQGKILTEAGKVLSRQSSVMSDDPDEAEKAMQELMFRELRFFYNVSSISTVEPIRRQIMLEHNVRVQDFEFIVTNSPFVPENREPLFALGFYSGMTGDYIQSTHLLIPQIENSIRYILSRIGVITSGYDSDGIQDEYNLNKTLYLDELKKVLGEDLVFDLRGLLIEKSCCNLRNRMAHGLLPSQSFISVETIYLWWLVLRLCCLPIIKKIHEPTE